MTEDQIFDQFRLWRSWSIELLENVPDEKLDAIPEHFSNNIRWNMGHVLVGWDHAIYTTLGEERRMSLKYHLMFPRGSRPSEWKEEPPSYDELLRHLKDQTEEIIASCRGKLDTEMEEPFIHMKTLGEMFLFMMNHEALHLSTMKALIQVQETESVTN